jgi:WD40 repeat protein
MWGVADGRRLARMGGHAGIVIALAVSPRDGTVASGGLDGSIRLWDGNDGRFLGQAGAQDAGVMALAFSPDGTGLASGVGSGADTYSAATWNVATGRRIARYDGHDNIVLAAALWG